ncbi:serine/threonine protein kinase [Planctomyces sp. SH-PL62]|uniref:serine/threonine protein kinase n=1 Tax=Planctomyces sp. SH-PL62 TaxID=1636152 RepID=UPI00078D3ACE|nr:serine/threonine-protein kinase [Planctomyces sp. SH-PL62]AMV37930.1 Serine/threonine-protein kinase StkP [Planctomyces sp. SH-PL62]
MPELDAETLVGQLPLIGLLSRDQFFEAKAEAEDGSPEAVLRACLRKGWITSWQVERLKKGDASHFFFGPYRALFHLAEGTFARVYRGEHSQTGEPVAIKVLRGRFASLPDAVASFHKEAEAGMRLKHENIVHILDSGRQEDKHYMAMEYVEGMNLRELLRLRTRFKGDEALPLMIGLAEGLKYSHGQGVTHRDIKATNILIANSGVAKLVDFGLATIQADDSQAMKSQRTVDYSALERSCGSPKGDPRSDIFFLGCVFYYMLTGQVALQDSESKDPLKKMLKRSFGGIRPLGEHPYAPDAGLSRIIEKMMRMDLKARYQTMAEVAADLEAYREARRSGAAPGGPKSDHELDVDLELGSSIFQNPFLTNDPDSPPVSTAEEALALDLSTFETHAGSGEAEDLGALLGIAPDEEPEAEPEPKPEARAESAPEARPTLLCVESQVEIQDALRKNLARRGYRVLLMADPERAAERYREAPTTAVVFDLDGQGPGALRHLADMRAKAEEDGVPFRVLVLLGPRQGGLQAKLPPADEQVVLSKPVKLKDVQEVLAALAPVG